MSLRHKLKPGSGLDGWRPRLGRARLMAALRTFAAVATVTLLLWVWADLERESREDVMVPVKVVPPAGGELRIVTPAEPVPVSLTLTGPKERLAEFTRWLRERAAAGEQVLYEVQADPAWRPEGEYAINVAEALRDWEQIRGLSPSDAAPQTIAVKVDRWVQVSARVELWTSDNAALQDVAVVPEQVTIRVPSSRLAEVGTAPVIRTQELKLDKYTPGQEVRRENIPLANNVNGVPARPMEQVVVTATFRVVSRTAAQEFAVNVEVQAPPEVLERIAREGLLLDRKDDSPLGEWRLNLRVRGPLEAIQRAANDRSIRAFIRIDESDLLEAATYPAKPVTVVLPAGLELESPASPTVSLRFVPLRPAPSALGQPGGR